MIIPVESAIAALLKPLGLRRKGRTWWRSNSFAVQVVNLQRGWGDRLHVNLGILIRELDETELPQENHCHVRARLERVCPEVFLEPVQSLIAPAPASDKALEALAVHGIAWLEALSFKEGLCQYVCSNGPSIGFVHKLAKEACGMRLDA
jgi:hypothetical protein